MLDALERISRKLVSAEKARRIDNYVCPECDAPVILHAGGARTAYFAHASGLSDEDCVRFVVGGGNVVGYELPGVPNDYVEALQLQLRTKRNGRQHAWALEIVIPTFRANYGSIVIDVGGRTQEISLEGNTSLYRSISAIPQASPYKILDVEPAYGRLASLEKTCAGLGDHFATVFGPIDRPDATEVPRSTTLQPERTYALIWAKTCSPAFPEELATEALISSENWCGAMVVIPHQISTNCYAWLQQFTQLKFIKAAPAIVPVWPPLLRSISPQLIETLPQSPFHFFVEHVAGALAPPVFARSTQDERAAKADSHNAPLYVLSPEGAKSIELMCRGGPRLDADFKLDATELKSIRPGAVKMLAVNKEGMPVNSVLHSCESSSWLLQVRSGELTFKAMTLPMGARGQVKIRRDFEWMTELELAGDGISRISPESVTNSNADLAIRLINILRDPSLSVMIDFSSFGRALIFGAATSELKNECEVSKAILRRIRQYFLQFPEALPVGSRWRKFSANQLLGEFQKSTPTRKSLAHYRFIQNNIPNNGNQ